MQLNEAQALLAEAVENQQAHVPTDKLALACATVILHGNLMGLQPLELPQNTVLVVQAQ